MICVTLVLYRLAIRQSESPLRTRYSIMSTVVVAPTAEFVAIAAGDHLRPFGDGIGDMLLNLENCVGIDQRPGRDR